MGTRDGASLRTRETVLMDTPVAEAMSRIVTVGPGSAGEERCRDGLGGSADAAASGSAPGAASGRFAWSPGESERAAFTHHPAGAPCPPVPATSWAARLACPALHAAPTRSRVWHPQARPSRTAPGSAGSGRLARVGPVEVGVITQDRLELEARAVRVAGNASGAGAHLDAGIDLDQFDRRARGQVGVLHRVDQGPALERDGPAQGIDAWNPAW